MVGKQPINCGQCIACRINRKREWVGRLRLEALHSGPSAYITLTYNDDFLPEGGSLNPLDWKHYYDRLRHRSGIGAVRYFTVGEYGGKKGRPHYHALLFDVPPTPQYARLLNECWAKESRKGQRVPMGFVDVGIVQEGSIDYVANYTLKKLNGDQAVEEYGDRAHPFCRMSRRPPIGSAGIARIVSNLHSRSGAVLLARQGDVPNTYVVGGRRYPIPSYFIEKMRLHFGIEKPTRTPWEISIDEASKDRKQAARKAAQIWEKSKRARRAKEIH